jgi:bacillithiol system protein YtxJ
MSVTGAIFRDLFTPADADLALAASQQHPVVIYKHSPICDLSADAIENVQEFLRSAAPDLDVRIVDVLTSRPASRHLEAITGVRHESPQVLVLRDGAVIWNASHRRITAGAVTDALARS